MQRLNKARLWSLDHLPEYAKNTAELTKLPEDVLLSAYTAQRTSPIAIDENIVKEVQEASDRATRYGILSEEARRQHGGRPQLYGGGKLELTPTSASAIRRIAPRPARHPPKLLSRRHLRRRRRRSPPACRNDP